MPESVIINFMYQHCFLRNRINLLTVLISFLQSHSLPLACEYNNVQSFYMGSPCSKIYVLQHPCQSACYKKVSKKIRKNSHIYLDVMDKLSTFAPALLERQSLMIDILLMIKGSENKNKKTSKKVWMLSEKVLIFASAFVKKAVRRRPHQFFEILINNTSSTRKDRTVNTICYICSYICDRYRYQNEVNKLYGILNRARTSSNAD